ncbi:MAG: alpha-ketoacid dehydrogenase subunit beta [Nitrospirae bacterium]|nr:MAG: alpha-ketoacid dehydrogenase subunit beta [Nitrospirota bacterium]
MPDIERHIDFATAVLEATDQCMSDDKSVFIIGLGVTDPKGIFNTTIGLEAKYGSDRVMDMPVSENAMTGVMIGASLVGMRPILTHQRIDFMLLALDQVINNAAKWRYMFGGRQKVPIVIRVLVGRGWGQGAQHAQSLQSLFAHIPGLKVVMPTTPYDAKGLLISAIRDDNPVIYIDHRWLHNITGPVPEERFEVPIGKARIMREGKDLTIVAASYMSLEALRAAEVLEKYGIDAEVVDLRTLRPLDEDAIAGSVKKTGRLIAIDGSWKACSMTSEIVAIATEHAFDKLKAAPVRINYPEAPSPTTPALANLYYPKAIDIINPAFGMLGKPSKSEEEVGIVYRNPLDVPDRTFKGPF